MWRAIQASQTRGRRALGVVRTLLLCAALGGAMFLLVDGVREHYAIQHWLVWRYLAVSALTLFWGASATLFGNALLHRALRLHLRLGEHAFLSFALGTLSFFVLAFVCGALRLYGTTYFILSPLILAGAGLWLARRQLKSLFRRRARLLAVSKQSPFDLALFAAGLLCVALLYVSILHPNHTSYDARWYHLGMAEQYAAYGGIFRSAEGSFVAAYPLLGSFIYGWAFLLPKSLLFDQVNLASHLEFLIFVVTLLGVSCVASRLVPRMRVRHAWVARFLFPGVFVYDSSLLGGGDHIAALWSPAIAVALFLVYRSSWVGAWALTGLMIAGCALTKYTSIALLVPAALVLAWLTARESLRAMRSRTFQNLRGPGLAAALALVVTAPHWLKNWIWYKNPVYPLAHGLFGGTPWTPDTSYVFDVGRATTWAPRGDLGSRLLETCKSIFTFSFIPHDWPDFHGSWPVFGFLFTLLLLCLPFLKRSARIALAAALLHVALFVWYWTQHEDRYLQALAPLMAACVAATLALLWRQHWVVRCFAAGPVALQVLWGLDAPFIESHAMVRTTPFHTSLTLASTGYKKNYEERLQLQSAEVAVQRLLPATSKAVLHEQHLLLGFRRPIVADFPMFQGGISYGRVGGRRALHRFFSEMGVTHFIWVSGQSRAADSVAGDFAFFDYVVNVATQVGGEGGYRVSAQPSTPLADTNDLVAFFGCPNDSYAHGLYERSKMTVMGLGRHRASEYPKPRVPIGTTQPDSLVAQAQFVMTGQCGDRPSSRALASFTQVASRGTNQLWIRKRE